MKNRFRNWSDLRVFLAVVRSGSTLAASKNLGMSQPTVARRIDVLEHELGLTLFERETRGFRPTEVAKGLITQAESVEASIEAFAKAASNYENTKNKVIKFTGVPEFFSENFAAIISEFTNANPDISFEFLATPARMDIAAGEADVAVRYTNDPIDPSIIATKISEAERTLFASDAYIRRYGLPSSENDFGGHKFVTMSSATGKFQDWIEARVEPDQIVMDCDSFSGLTTAILSGLGIGPLNVRLGRENPLLTAVIPPPKGVGVTTWLLTSPAANQRREVRKFVQFFAPRYTAFITAENKERDERARRAKKD
ncbi:MAG: LysR family transcriptional regulator [Boseongicola sp.]|nr:LysR family transcriptional regulator [Boseongicola sp.]MDD9978964.1 LysR family transcriptional regulator [Boseongicola sp.]